MCMHDHPHRGDARGISGTGAHAPRYRSRQGISLLGFLAVGAYFLWTEHRAHVVALLPFGLLLLCPLTHVFMHHGHGQQGNNDENRKARHGA